MDQRDHELLMKQFGHFVPPPRRDGLLALAIAAVFLAGIAAGGFLFALTSEPPMRTAASGGSAELSFFLNGVPPTRSN
jgi:hypothetical protein